MTNVAMEAIQPRAANVREELDDYQSDSLSEVESERENDLTTMC